MQRTEDIVFSAELMFQLQQSAVVGVVMDRTLVLPEVQVAAQVAVPLPVLLSVQPVRQGREIMAVQALLILGRRLEVVVLAL
jgi:hypothetical protein